MLTVPIHKAIERGDQCTIKQWLQNEDTEVNYCRGGNASRQPFAVADGTALHWAVFYGQLDIALLLLQNGAGISSAYDYTYNLVNHVHSKLFGHKTRI